MPQSPLVTAPGWRANGTQSGFTLIEIMVVVVIMGILATFISLSIGNRSVEDRLQTEAKRLQQLVLFAADQAQIQGMEIGLRTTTEGFEFLSMDSMGLWQGMDDGPLRPRDVPAPFYVDLYVEGQKVAPVVVDRAKERQQREEDQAKKDGDDDGKLVLNEKPKNRPQPQVYLLSSGDASAFAMDLRLKSYPAFYRLECDVLTRCTLQRLQDKS